jgi:hypothetical protein
MKTGAVIGIFGGLLALIGVGSVTVYDLEEKKKCAAAGGVWNGILKGCSCPSGYVLSNGHCCPEGTNWNGTECVSSGGTVSNPPDQVDPSTITIIWGTPTADSAPGSLNWTQPATATSAKVTVNGVSKTVIGPPVAITATPEDQVLVSIAPCN